MATIDEFVFNAHAHVTVELSVLAIKISSLSNICPIIIYFQSSQCRLIPHLHQRPIFFKTNSSIVAILELIRGAQCLIEVIRSSTVVLSGFVTFLARTITSESNKT
jgi:hypothetical protein